MYCVCVRSQVIEVIQVIQVDDAEAYNSGMLA